MAKHARWTLGLLLIGAMLLPAPASATGRYIVQWRDAARGRAAIADAGGSLVLELPAQNAAAAMLPEQAIAGLRNNPNIERVEVDPQRFPFAETTPWGITAIEAPQLWPQPAYGGRTVCIIDSGFALGHEDLQRSSISGYPSGWSQDGCGHGTHVAGTVAALSNGAGVVGVNPSGTSLYVIKVFGTNCNWSYASTLIDALNRCRSAGAHVVSMSLGGPYKSFLEQSAFDSAWNAGVLSVAAAGNDGNTAYNYPASYPSVISVAAVDASKRLASFSQRNNQVDLAAPGVGVLSTVPWSPYYESWSGTSMATPHVSAAAALVWSYNPAWTNAQIRQALEATAEDLGSPGRDDSYGYGFVRARHALDWLKGAANQLPVPSFSVTCTGLDCAFTDTSRDPDGEIASRLWNFGDGSTATEANPRHTFAAPGTFTVGLTVTDAGGAAASTSQPVTVSDAAALSLTATSYRVKGRPRVDLKWSGATTAVNVLRGGKTIAASVAGTSWTDTTLPKGGGTFTYQVCETTGRCSNAVTVTF